MIFQLPIMGNILLVEATVGCGLITTEIKQKSLEQKANVQNACTGDHLNAHWDGVGVTVTLYCMTQQLVLLSVMF